MFSPIEYRLTHKSFSARKPWYYRLRLCEACEMPSAGAGQSRLNLRFHCQCNSSANEVLSTLLNKPSSKSAIITSEWPKLKFHVDIIWNTAPYEWVQLPYHQWYFSFYYCRWKWRWCVRQQAMFFRHWGSRSADELHSQAIFAGKFRSEWPYLSIADGAAPEIIGRGGKNDERYHEAIIIKPLSWYKQWPHREVADNVIE